MFAIFFFVFREAAPVLFGKLNLVEFFTSTDWQPTSDVRPQYGILALLVGTLSVTVLAMVLAVPLGLGAAVYISEFCAAKSKETLKIIDRAAGGHSVDRVGIHRLHGARAADHPS